MVFQDRKGPSRRKSVKVLEKIGRIHFFNGNTKLRANAFYIFSYRPWFVQIERTINFLPTVGSFYSRVLSDDYKLYAS